MLWWPTLPGIIHCLQNESACFYFFIIYSEQKLLLCFNKGSLRGKLCSPVKNRPLTMFPSQEWDENFCLVDNRTNFSQIFQKGKKIITCRILALFVTPKKVGLNGFFFKSPFFPFLRTVCLFSLPTFSSF